MFAPAQFGRFDITDDRNLGNEGKDARPFVTDIVRIVNEDEIVLSRLNIITPLGSSFQA